ncbi:MOTI protein, partial [Alectura lathami]|nr:MOTI protein [Alectura lathami]
MVLKKVADSLLLLYAMSVLPEQTEGFMPFFTQSDFQIMQEKERSKGQENSVTPLQQLEEEGLSEQYGADVNRGRTIQLLLVFLLPPQLAVPVRAEMWLILRQLEKYQDVLEKLLAGLLQDTPDG